MKKFNLFVTGLVLFIMYSCSGGNQGSTGIVADDKSAVCIWDNLPLKETPTEAGKYICSVSIGEAVTYLDEEKTDNAGKKEVTYVKIKLKDNKEGWAQANLVVLNSKPAAVLEDAEVYSRPDLLNKTGKLFSKMDIVAVKSEKDGFIEVTGKRKNGKWTESGWLKIKSVTYEPVDIAVAKYAGKLSTDKQKRAEGIQEIINNPDLKSSVFISSLAESVAEKEAPVQEEAIKDTSKTL